ncbi:MAG TPA: nucleotide exchange factor GrpE [Candidatus Paceibacterota bacterium]|nr:nucleotide exchange factor GrpE [Candidatus Paceibacterota bacterium]
MKKKPDENEEIVFEDDGSRLEDKLKRLREELKTVEKEKAEYLAGWQRERADFVNYKKDSNKNLVNSIELTKNDLLSEFLGVLDSFNLALLSPQWNDLPADWQQGMKSILGQFSGIFKEYGVSEIGETAIFDPFLHEAIHVVETKNKEEDGKIAKVVNKGYKTKDKVLRATKVEVFKYKHE